MSDKLRILVVDDDHFILLAVARPLRKEGYEVVEAMRVEQVLEAAESGKFDVVIVDIFMPGMGGIEAIERIHAASPNSKIVAITAGYGDMPPEKTIEAAKKIGAAAGFPKPVDVPALLKQIQEWEKP